MNDELALRPQPVRRTVAHEDDGTQTWTTTWTLTVTRGPAAADRAGALARPYVTGGEPFAGAPGTAVTEPVVLHPLPVQAAAPWSGPIPLPAAPVAGPAPRPLPSRREVHGRVAVTAPAGDRAPARTPRPARAPKPPAPAFLRVSLGLAVGVGLVVAGIRAHALDAVGLHATDNGSVATSVSRFLDRVAGN